MNFCLSLFFNDHLIIVCSIIKIYELLYLSSNLLIL